LAFIHNCIPEGDVKVKPSTCAVHWILKGMGGLVALLWPSGAAFAQRSQAGDAAGCAACGGCGMILIAIPIGILMLDIALLVWVARDAKSRGMDNSVLWMVLVMFLSLLGLIIYILSRPKGNLIPCQSCNNKRLEASALCPYCGNA
jgi:Phospholipase_D-nuclease N-terminal